MNKNLEVVIEIPTEDNRVYAYMDIIGRFPVFRKWWQFWKNRYEDIPLRIKRFL